LQLEKELKEAQAVQPASSGEAVPAGGEKESELQVKLEALQKEKEDLDKVRWRGSSAPTWEGSPLGHSGP
jgi:hypothetical protein